MSAPVIHGSDEALVLDLLRERSPMMLSELAICVGIHPKSMENVLARLRGAGYVRAVRRGRYGWELGRCPLVRELDTTRLGLRSAMRRVYQAGSSYSAAQMAARFGAPIAITMTEVSKLCASGEITRAEPGEALKEDVVYRARTKRQDRPEIGFEPGAGDRRDDCARYMRCLAEYDAAGEARCPGRCSAYQRVEAVVGPEHLVRRTSQFTAMGY